MTPIIVRSTIDVQDNASNVEVAMIIGFANFSSGTISVKPVGGTMTTLVPNMQANTRYSLGPAADLITKHIRMILTGEVGDPNGAVEGSFYVTCAFYQNGQAVGSSDPVSGKYAAGDALQVFNIVCSFT
jgi:hypothetical protein